MISHKYQCIFVEVPKTGSTSIRSIIGNPKKPHLDAVEIKKLLTTHWPFRFYNPVFNFLYQKFVSEQKQLHLGEKLFSHYFKFGFVRNPWDRVVSLFERKEGIQMKGTMTFPEFVDWIQYSSDTCVHPSRHKNQMDWFTNDNGDFIVDFIGKFENIEQDWEKIAREIGAPPHLPHKNKKRKKGKNFKDYYDERTKEVIREKFGKDIEYFGYSFND